MALRQRLSPAGILNNTTQLHKPLNTTKQFFKSFSYEVATSISIGRSPMKKYNPFQFSPEGAVSFFSHLKIYCKVDRQRIYICSPSRNSVSQSQKLCAAELKVGDFAQQVWLIVTALFSFTGLFKFTIHSFNYSPLTYL